MKQNFIYDFPDPNTAPNLQPLCMGGDFSSECLLSAYSKGIFPWMQENDTIFWFSPNPRAVLFPKDVKIQKSIKPFLNRYEVKFDNDFEKFINFCKNVRESRFEETWISKDFVKAYANLANLGIAHSVEVFENDELIGGLYGLILGKVFCGESMISVKANASKVALIRLCEVLEKFEFMIDCQVMNEHLKFMGAKDMKRAEFLNLFYNLSQINSGFDDFKGLNERF